VLTDHHTHLRPDDTPLDEEALSIETIVPHVAAAMDAGLAQVAVTEHVYRFRVAKPAWAHPYWDTQTQWDIDAYWEALAEAKAAGFPLLIGIECDWLPEHQDVLVDALAGRPWDVLLGSIHWVDEGAVDYDLYSAFKEIDPDALWRGYVDRYTRAALSGQFDVMTHADLPKSFGPLPSVETLDWALDRIADALAEAGCCTEISTAGLRKAAREIYPGPSLLERCCARGVPVVLSSDAHEPEHVGFAFDQAVEAALAAGYTEVQEFKGRDRRGVPIG
jgi:histidinol-phosphatase (PHP family)